MSTFPARPLVNAITPSKQAARRHYGSHPYFTKRAWNVVQEYIRHFSSAGDTVLDPFGGSGVTAVESLVLRRKAIYLDISAWATFLARQTAVAPVNLSAFRDAFLQVEESCRPHLDQRWVTPEAELAGQPVQDWYPKGVPLPRNADVHFVEELFTPRMLHGLARLRAAIMACEDAGLRDLLLLSFSATLVRINRTFLSAKNRVASRGGSAIFSIYRYKVAKRPVELPLWEQFALRCQRLMEAKRETNQLIADYYQENDTAVFQQGSATRLLDSLKPQSVDYIYTDPPYGGHIAYLDLSTMWAAWLGFGISADDRAQEVIEGGDLHKTRDDYQALLAQSLLQMHEVLKPGAWMSIVFAHRDTTYWDALVDACASAGFQYANTVVQPVGVVWSMHKKKNPLRVLSGELVLNFRKPTKTIMPSKKVSSRCDPVDLVRQCSEVEIIRCLGATTEQLHHAVVPKLLEAGLLGAFSKDHGDLVPVLMRYFDYESTTQKWQVRANDLSGSSSDGNLMRYHIARFLQFRHQKSEPVDEAAVGDYVRGVLGRNGEPSDKAIGKILREVGSCPDGQHWIPRHEDNQGELF